MLFSALIPVYNAQEFLNRCLDSILGQSWKDFEVVLVNDGSTDESGEICDFYAREYPDTVRVIHQENKGALLTRRTAMQAAKGEFFLFPDSDDYIYPHTMSTIAESIETYHCDMVLYDFNRVDLYTKETKIIRQLPQIEKGFNGDIDKNILYRQICKGNTAGALNTKAISRNLIDWDVDYKCWGNRICVSNDLFQIFPIVSKAKKIAYIQKPLYCYVKTSGSITTKFKVEKYDSYMENYRRREYYMNTWNITSKDRHMARIKTFNTVSNLLLQAYQRSKKTRDYQKFNWLFEHIRKDEYFNNQYLMVKNELSVKIKLIIGNLIKNRKLITKFILEIEYFRGEMRVYIWENTNKKR